MRTTEIECVRGQMSGCFRNWAVIVGKTGNFPMKTSQDVTDGNILKSLIYFFCLDRLAEQDESKIFRATLDLMAPGKNVRVSINKLRVIN